MKKGILASIMLACLPWFALAQSNDDLYFIPKKEKKTEVKQRTQTVREQALPRTTQSTPGTIVVRDADGKTRNVDEYNRRYTARDNNFSVANDTLYVDEKPYDEQGGEWVNGFDGTQDDYEYAMRIVRFRSPRYAIPVSSPLYWDVVYGGGAFPSWDWNVYDDGMYAYVFPTFSNPMWWDWRWSWGMSGPYWGFGWRSPWYYNSWYSPWYGGYWGGYYGGYWGPGYYGHHHYPYYGGWGNYSAYNYNNRRGDIGYSSRYNSFNSRNGGNSYTTTRGSYNAFDRNGRTGGRVVRGSNDASVRGNSNGGRSVGTYTRPSTFGGQNSYTRPSSTRSNSYRESGSYERMQQSGGSRNNSGTFSRGSSSGSTFGGGSYRSGGGSSTRSSGGGSSTGGGGGARRR